jgi:hypothetical protein
MIPMLALAACGGGGGNTAADAAVKNHPDAGLANTGEACTTPADCAGGANKSCILTTGNSLTWPGGYCSNTCTTTANDPNNQVNPSCPGNATCVGAGGTSGSCQLLCNAGECRTGYSCFNTGPGVSTCAPTALSQCDPTMANSCNSTSMVCVQIGLDPVGQCEPTCNPFAQDCTDPAYCYASPTTGVGSCADSTMSGADGTTCGYLNDCDKGLDCYQGTCRPYCGGPSAVACTNGKACVDLSPQVAQSVVGVCGG